MARITAGRRPLHFDSLAEVMPDVDRLLPGYTTLGHWSLGQVCNHLTGALIFSVEGFEGRAPWLIRATLGPIAKRRVLATGRMAEGFQLPEKFLPRPDLDDRAEAEALRGALKAFDAHTGPMASHPFFGPLDRATWTRIHCIHCAHHLSFILPAG